MAETQVAGKRKEVIGNVVSNRMNKTIVVQVVRNGSLCDASRIASLASCGDTPSISNRILPGFTTATQ